MSQRHTKPSGLTKLNLKANYWVETLPACSTHVARFSAEHFQSEPQKSKPQPHLIYLNLFGLIVYCSTKVISWPTDPRIQFVWKSCFGCILARQRNITDWKWSEHNFCITSIMALAVDKTVNAAATTTFFQNRQTAITEVISRSWLPCTTFGSWSLGISSKWKHINPLTVSFCLRCVCVCENRYHIRYNSTMQGAHGSDSWRGPTKLQVPD